MPTAKDNLAKLPEVCYSVNNVTRKLIAIRAGMSGYHEVSDHIYNGGVTSGAIKPPKQDGSVFLGGSYDAEMKHMNDVADMLNRDSLAVTKAQRAAMECGSYANRWDLPGCDPDYYDKNGRHKKK